MNMLIFSPRDTRRVLLTLRQALLIGALALLVSCAGNDEQDELAGTVTEAYEKARDSVARKNYRRGIQIFEAIQARFPFSDFARQVQLELMYAYYKSGQSEQAIEAADTFMRENPIHPRVDYALYITALAHFEGEPGFTERWFRKDMTKRPPEGVGQSYANLRRLVDRYPASPYSADAVQRMLYLKNRLAAYENHVAGYYMRRGAYVAALNRAQDALEEFHGATGNVDSLIIMAAAYEKLGMMDLASDTRRVLDLNFPDQ